MKKHMSSGRLAPKYLKRYLALRKQTGSSSISKAYLNDYNRQLRLFFLDCQKRDFFPSEEYVGREAKRLLDAAIKAAESGVRELEHIDGRRLDAVLVEMQLLPTIRTMHSSDGGIDHVRLEVRGILDLARLSPAEVDTLKSSELQLSITEETVGVCTLVNIPIYKPISEAMQERINGYASRLARQLIAKKVLRAGGATPFRYSLKERIGDFFLSLAL